MKWTPNDIKPGIEIVHPRGRKFAIGYLLDEPSIFVLIDLSDGGVGERQTKEQLVEMLNHGNFLPRYSPV